MGRKNKMNSMSKKGAFTITAMGGIVLLLCIAVAVLMFAPSSVPSTNYSATNEGDPIYEMSISNLNVGNEAEIGDNNFEIIVTNASYTNTSDGLTMTFNMDVGRLDDLRNDQMAYYDTLLIFDAQARSFNNVIDTSDSLKYYTVNYVDSDDQYNLSIGSTSFATTNNARVTVGQEANEVVPVTIELASADDLDKSTKEAFSFSEIAKITSDAGSVVVKYMKQ